MAASTLKQALVTLVTFLITMLLTACGLPLPGQLPVEIPGVPSDWDDLQSMLGDLGLPDLSALGDVPGLDALTGLETPPGAIAFQGPLEIGLNPGQALEGTDIRFVEVEDDESAAHFVIDGLNAPRRLGDSLDFDGAWPGIEGVTYHLRLRLYRIDEGEVRAAGVQRLVVANVSPQVATIEVNPASHSLRFPHTVTSSATEQFAGMTLGYGGQDERGATVSGLPEGEYPYRKLGDSVEWAGRLAPNLPVEYHLRLLYYQEANATLGGVAIVSLPGS